ncbi:large ribosomal subunit protein mL55 isoform X2 [Opisthocomus hoazin]|uniref:large ribosomal subunit protein mL55 isoform X2 n=1 Tax=Opisthocomus hoazin TaxID=30419 RepID=UPI003F5372FB
MIVVGGTIVELNHIRDVPRSARAEDPSSLACTTMASWALSNSNRASVCHLHRQLYGRLYPVFLVNTDGSTVRLRYREPKRLLTLPLDSSTLPEAQRRARLRRQVPSRPKAGAEETFEGIDLGTYSRFWKK